MAGVVYWQSFEMLHSVARVGRKDDTLILRYLVIEKTFVLPKYQNYWSVKMKIGGDDK